MEQGYQYSHLIFEYLLLRFRFGYYQYGDIIPPIESFCRKFGVADKTVKSALHRLRDEGYIELCRGRPTQVLFYQTGNKLHDYMTEHFSQRWNSLSDLYTSAEYIFVPLLVEGLRRMSKNELDVLDQSAKQAGVDDLFHFYFTILQKLENPLGMNFFWETVMFQGFLLAKAQDRPTRYDHKTVRERMSKLISNARERHWNTVHDTLVHFLRTDIGKVTAYWERQIHPLPLERQRPFVWRLYRDRPQICYKLSFGLLHEIYMGEYRNDIFLPSYAELAEKYEVSVNTIRRAVGMLNKVGAAQTVNGKGTLIYTLGKRCNPPDFADPMIRRNLSFFVQAFELLLFTCEYVTRAFLLDMSPEVREDLLRQLRKNLRGGHSDASLWYCLLYIAQHSHLQVIREFYGTIYGLFLWGYPLKSSLTKVTELDSDAVKFTESMIRYLEYNDVEQCACTLKALVSELFPKAERYLLFAGIHLEELRLSRIIQFQTDGLFSGI